MLRLIAMEESIVTKTCLTLERMQKRWGLVQMFLRVREGDETIITVRGGDEVFKATKDGEVPHKTTKIFGKRRNAHRDQAMSSDEGHTAEEYSDIQQKSPIVEPEHQELPVSSVHKKRRIVFGREREDSSKAIIEQESDRAERVEDYKETTEEHVPVLGLDDNTVRQGSEPRKTVFALRSKPELEDTVSQEELEITGTESDHHATLQTLRHPLEEEIRRIAEKVRNSVVVDLVETADADDDYDPYDREPDDELLFLLASKVEEFHWLEYREVTIADLWDYFKHMGKKRPQSLHDLVNAVMCLQPQAFMNFSLKRAYRAPTLDKLDLKGLI